MLNILLIVVIAVLLITDVIFLAWIRNIKDRIVTLNTRQEYCNRLIEINNEFSDRLHGLAERIIDGDSKRDDIINAMIKSYDAINDQYTDILKTDRKLMDVWEKIEERYSDSYEQFLKCDDAIRTAKAELQSQMTIRTHDILAAMPMHCPAFNVPDEETLNDILGIDPGQYEFEDLSSSIRAGDILEEDWDILKQEYRDEILAAGFVDADRLGEMILDSRKEFEETEEES